MNRRGERQAYLYGHQCIFSILDISLDPASLAWQKRILVVDDHPRIQKLVRFFLGGQPEFDVCSEAVDGLDAIEKAKTLNPDLIILDLHMPRMERLGGSSSVEEYAAKCADNFICPSQSRAGGFGYNELW